MVFPNCDYKIVKRVFKVIFTLLKKNGTLFTVKYLKTCRLLITRYMCGRPIYRNTQFISTKGGFPTKFIYLKSYIDSGNVERIKFVLTLMNISRTIVPRKKENILADFSSIIDGPKKRFKTIPGSFIIEFNKQFSLKMVKPKFTSGDFFLNLKMGPQGPSILSITETVKALSAKQLWYIHELVGEDFFKRYIGPFYSFMKHNNIQTPDGKGEFAKYCKFTNKPKTGRLSIIKDPECKMRVIAISDYFSQFSLKPVHQQLMTLLSKLPCDRTYTQNPFHD